MFLDHGRDGVAIDIAHDNHRHQIRTVPITVEPRQLLTLRVLDAIGFADGRPLCVARSLELHAADLVLRPLARAEVHPPFRQDDAALAVDAALIEHGALRPVLEDQQRAIDDARHVGRHPQDVLRVIVAGRRIRVRTDAQTERRQEVDDALPRKVPRAFELHVFDEVRQPLLVIVFQRGTGLHDEPHLSPVARLLVRAHVVAQAVRQGADEDFRIHRHLL